MTEKLKPCPFCGKSDLLEIMTHERNVPNMYRWTADITCLHCFGNASAHGFYITEDEAKSEAIKAWNRRAE